MENVGMNYSQYNIDGANVNEETVGHLRQRLNVMREIVKDEDKDGKKKGKRRKGKCIDTIIDGSLMGAVLAVCLAMVIGASFFAYKNLYFAVMKKWYPETYKN
eukprot:GFUD01014142.1.p1 GENE.GFUD01014142.1~~GFUD01014142.1.p1  ORF type:complete len:103 (+),score=27.75 GFUD01014142.1:148-456(+)